VVCGVVWCSGALEGTGVVWPEKCGVQSERSVISRRACRQWGKSSWVQEMFTSRWEEKGEKEGDRQVGGGGFLCSGQASGAHV
jgi:hypothetical protein